MSERMKLPKIGDELYEHYPSMSAQTHEAEVKRYAKSCLELMRAEQASVVTALQEEVVRLGQQCEGLAQAAANNAQDLILKDAKLSVAEARANAAEQRLKDAVKVLEPFAAGRHDMRNTHLLDWLHGGYTHCKYGSEEWAQSYLNSAKDYIKAFEEAASSLIKEIDQ